ncbi:hypothetical protein Dimus_017108 [Dionaea muscipula]
MGGMIFYIRGDPIRGKIRFLSRVVALLIFHEQKSTLNYLQTKPQSSFPLDLSWLEVLSTDDVPREEDVFDAASDPTIVSFSYQIYDFFRFEFFDFGHRLFDFFFSIFFETSI